MNGKVYVLNLESFGTDFLMVFTLIPSCQLQDGLH